MKSKFNIWLNIVTMCLCVCAITIGIYSLKQANLTVSGSIGFVSSKIKYDVTAQMKGYMTKSGDVETFHDEFESLDVNTNANDEKSIALSEIYFSNPEGSETVSDIVIELTITNNSSYPIEATLGLPNNETILTNVDFTKSQNVVAQMGTTTDNGKTQTMTINMSLVGTELTSTPVAFNFSITLNKFEQIKHDDTIGYYTTMGSHIVGSGTLQEVKAVKWLPIATYDASYTTDKLYNYKPFSNTTEPTSGNKYYFISENILDFDTGGVSYNNTYNYSTNKDTEYPELNANNYLASSVRALLKGDTVYNSCTIDSTYKQYIESGQQVNLLNEYGIQGYTYESITARTAEQLYEVENNDKSYASMTDEIYEKLKTPDRLWLISLTEANTYYSTDEARAATQFLTTEYQNWWTRSCKIEYSGNAYYIIKDGDTTASAIIQKLFIRPAFTLEIQ